jgi:3-hydroxybutyryl-CoA dehydratase
MRNNAAIYYYDEIEIDSVYSFTRTITQDDVSTFASLSGDFNPLHVNKEFGRSSQFGKNVVHGMLSASLFSTLVGMYCPGEKCLYLGQTLQFRMPLFYGETVKVKGTVTNKVDALKMLKMKTEIFRDNDLIVYGEAQIQLID